MVLGLIELLLGKKKKRPVRQQDIYRTGNSTNPANAYRGSSNTNLNFGDTSGQNPGLNNNINNNGNMNNNVNNINDNKNSPIASQQSKNIPPSQIGGPNFVGSTPQNNPGQKRPISEVLMKIQSDLKENNNKVTELVTEIKEIQNNVLNLTHRVESLEENKKAVNEKFEEIDNNLGKFLSLYEVISNQYNPFVDNSEPPKKVVIDAATNNQEIDKEDSKNDDKNLKPKFDIFEKGSEDGLSPLLDLDTLDIKEAAGNAVPLTKIKNDTNSLALILSWLEYMINKVGIEETRNTLRYYTEVLKWIIPEVYFELDKYLKGLRDKKDLTGTESLSIKDHIVSLYFISKLNEKSLDEKLTKAVMKMIKS